MRNSSSYFAHIGFEKSLDSQGNIILTLPVTSEIVTESGDIPSGLFSSMLDIVIGSMIAEEVQKSTSTIHLSFNFFDLTNRGPFTSSAAIAHRDGKFVTGEGIVLDNDDQVVAKGIGTFKILY
ncbi:PaaI family thioesterase [Halobacillus sp. Marseille-Q1614]|uniref:PaaI family thioesterase n=1 Tax=Halobacillus sp. Marseille-Q1614 TaxID=2709134 RepID=UPI00156F655B|nr:hypothetical protein [Halobacillus sp. Marseille-Q1614]